jgi:hypothetical protein
MTEPIALEIDVPLMNLAKEVARHSVGDLYGLMLLAAEVKLLREAIQAKKS